MKINIKKLLLTLSLFLTSFIALADEGMWIPLLLKQLNEGTMQKLGMKLTAEDIYSVNKSSLKDAIVLFGGGCTGAMVSPEGLLLTNHHCGYGQIQSHSSVQNNYLKNGFWAKSKAEELVNPTLTVTFVIRIEDVTKAALQGVTDTSSETTRAQLIADNIKKIEAAATQGTHYAAQIRPYFYGNEYYMVVTETFRDVRLVGAPPESIGKFGGDTDNWMWPRHTGDFSVFRVYANDKNEPADYSPTNKPYKPKNFLTVSLKGYKPGDFTMTYGFPGRTFEYLTSYGIKQVVQVSNPNNIKIRERRLSILQAAMKEDDAVRIQYASKYAGISNYYKKFIGENKGMRVLNTITMKEALEARFQNWADTDPVRKAKYGNLLPQFKETYTQLYPLQLETDLYNEAGLGVELVKYAVNYVNLLKLSKDDKSTEQEIKTEVERVKKLSVNFFKDYSPATDQKVMAALLKQYAEVSKEQYKPAVFTTIKTQYNNDFKKFTDDLFAATALTDKQKMDALLASYTKAAYTTLESDKAVQLAQEIVSNYNQKIAAVNKPLTDKLNVLHRLWMQGLREMDKAKKFWPDANSTMRVAYGTVKGYKPFDGAVYAYKTTLSGVIEKADTLNEEFIVPKKLAELYAKKDFGVYAEKGDVPVAFVATNHTTGGNSGSPLLDAQGRLLGLNFDANWEGTMGNYHFDESRVRNISVDIRYILFIMDKFAGVKYLVDEMRIAK